jgi:hypothetical protein
MTALIEEHPDNVHDDHFLQAVRHIYANAIFDQSEEIRMTLAHALAAKPLTRDSVAVCDLIRDFSDLGLNMALSLQSTPTPYVNWKLKGQIDRLREQVQPNLKCSGCKDKNYRSGRHFACQRCGTALDDFVHEHCV